MAESDDTKKTAAVPIAAPARRGGRGEAERAERLAAALRANLSRRKAARRAGLDAFGSGDSEPGDEGGREA